ncbi:MAG: phosphatase PAP2 family protein [Acidobacteriia bacterium]|nr:phosphatase PAP2 family protein [Terriglobia bacterium]
MSTSTSVANAVTGEPHTLELGAGLRPGEMVALGFFIYGLVASLAFALGARERWLAVGLLVLTGAVVISMSRIARPSRLTAAVRDWFPAVLILVAYRVSGLFLIPDSTRRLDLLFVQWDRALLQNPSVTALLSTTAPWLQRYLELAYLMCYPLVPLGLAALSVAAVYDRRRGSAGYDPNKAALIERRYREAIDRFWTTVLLAVLTCYAIYPFFPLTPPRVLFHDVPGPVVEPLLRRVNFWILNQYSVQACIFPSGHVAAVTATALAVRAYLPRVGLLFLVAAASVALATVYGRYHYSADAVAGAAVAAAAFLVARRIQR